MTVEVLEEVFAVIEDRKETLPDGSYTASLFLHERGEDAILEKIGEETTEVILAAKNNDQDEIAHESADLLYHLLVLLSAKELSLDTVCEELEDRR